MSFKDRRLSREQGTVFKDWGGRLPVAVVYPNSYYIGMSNLGIQLLYSYLNSQSDVVAERFFYGAEDLKAKSVESGQPLAEFSIAAFAISYEPDYFNVVRLIRAAGLPLYAAERDERHPLLIAGGAPLMANPMPVAPFFDCICIGEAEAILPDVLAVVKEGASRKDTLAALARLPGVYVPGIGQKLPVVRQWAKDLDALPVASAVLTPDTELGDLFLIEAERGCNFNCRFCLVSSVFCPVRHRSLDGLLAKAREGLKCRRRVGLVGPEVSGHPQFEALLHGLRQLGAGISISSMRIKPFHTAAIGELAASGTKNIALAPEAGSERLRRVLGKGFSDEDVLAAVSAVASAGIRQIKLYFMVGLPTETEEDIQSIITLAGKCKLAADKARTGARLVLNVASFVPKAGTPFQWLPMADAAILNKRLAFLKKSLSPQGIKVKAESPAWSYVQAVLARGDESLAGVLADTEEVSLPSWRRALARREVKADLFTRQRSFEGSLPWEAIDIGVSRQLLEKELKKALAS